MDVLALLGIFQKKKRMILPWLLWYVGSWVQIILLPDGLTVQVHDGGDHSVRPGDVVARLHGVFLPPARPHQTSSQHVRLVQCEICLQTLLHHPLLQEQ